MSRDNQYTNHRNPERILVMSASVRTGSLNQTLARTIAAELRSHGEHVGVVDLADYPMPLYDGDLEARDGVPATAGALAERFGDAETLVIVSPEYNGAFPPLLKNTVDWVTRIDSKVLAHLEVLLASASPGGGGGSRGLAMIRLWMSNIGVAVADTSLSVGSAALADDGSVSGIDPHALAGFAGQARRTQRVAS